MAQWNGQFTGNTHSTKVEDYEYTLRHAIDVLNSSDDEHKSAKVKSVKKLAAKVLNARLKMVRAKRYEAEPVESNESLARQVHLDHLTELETKLTEDGVAGILIEFGATEFTKGNY